jgi:hypothetical protein
MSDTTYNGWTNYATWRVNLEVFDGMSVRDITGRTIAAPSELRHAVQEWVEQHIEETTQPGLGRDYALAFLSDVDWWQITEHLISAEEDAEV